MEKNRLVIKITLNQQKTRFFAEIRNTENEIIKEFTEPVVIYLAHHEKNLQDRCINWIKDNFK